ncbi:hypothetical protein Bca4012_001440 [Brassica carinata]
MSFARFPYWLLSFGWPAVCFSYVNAGRLPPPFSFPSSSPLLSLFLSVSFLEVLFLAPPYGVDLARRTRIFGETKWRSGCGVSLVKRNGGGSDLASDLDLWRTLSFPLPPLFDLLDLSGLGRVREGEKASSRSSQPRLAFSVAERPKSTRTEG